MLRPPSSQAHPPEPPRLPPSQLPVKGQHVSGTFLSLLSYENCSGGNSRRPAGLHPPPRDRVGGGALGGGPGARIPLRALHLTLGSLGQGPFPPWASVSLGWTMGPPWYLLPQPGLCLLEAAMCEGLREWDPGLSAGLLRVEGQACRPDACPLPMAGAEGLGGLWSPQSSSL